jgi:hypothetical protein
MAERRCFSASLCLFLIRKRKNLSKLKKNVYKMKGAYDDDDDDDDSSINEQMFPSGMPLPDGVEYPKEDERIKFSIPPHANADGKGWGPAECESEQAMFANSIAFLKAIADHDWDRVNQCLKSRVDLNFVDEKGSSAVHLAISARHADLLRFLLGQGADVTLVTDDGKTALHYAVAHNDIRAVVFFLHLHKLNGDWDKSIHRITKDTGDNALHLAALWGNARIAKRLIKAGVDFTCKNKEGQTPLMYAHQYGHTELAVLLQTHIDKEKAQISTEMRSQLNEWSAQQWMSNPPKYTQLSMDHFMSAPAKRVRFIDNQIHCTGVGYFGDADDRTDRERAFWESKARYRRDDDDDVMYVNEEEDNKEENAEVEITAWFDESDQNGDEWIMKRPPSDSDDFAGEA